MIWPGKDNHGPPALTRRRLPQPATGRAVENAATWEPSCIGHAMPALCHSKADRFRDGARGPVYTLAPTITESPARDSGFCHLAGVGVFHCEAVDMKKILFAHVNIRLHLG